MRGSSIGLSAAVLILAAGCSLPTPSTPPSAPPSAPASSAPSSDPSPSTQPTPADPGQPSTPDQLGDPVVTRTAQVDGAKVVLTLYPVFRGGTTSSVNLTLTAPDDGDSSVQVAQTFTDGNGSASDLTGDAADGLQLVDGKNAKVYLVASDGKGSCLCSRNLGNVFLKHEIPAIISATFAAPPADVTEVDVRIPNFGLVKNVPVQ